MAIRSPFCLRYWDTEFDRDKFCHVEVNFWRENQVCFSHSKIVYSDASSYPCGALIQGSEQFISHTMFTDQEDRLVRPIASSLLFTTFYKPLRTNFLTLTSNRLLTIKLPPEL